MMSPRLRWAALLGVLLVAAGFPAASLAAVGGVSGESSQLLLQVRGSS